MHWSDQVSETQQGGVTHATIAADYGFEYSDEEVQEDDIDIENQYYNSKGRHCDVSAVSLLEPRGGKVDMPAWPALCATATIHQLCSAGLLEGSDDPQEALKGFQEVVKMEEGQGEW